MQKSTDTSEATAVLLNRRNALKSIALMSAGICAVSFSPKAKADPIKIICDAMAEAWAAAYQTFVDGVKEGWSSIFDQSKSTTTGTLATAGNAHIELSTQLFNAALIRQTAVAEKGCDMTNDLKSAHTIAKERDEALKDATDGWIYQSAHGAKFGYEKKLRTYLKDKYKSEDGLLNNPDQLWFGPAAFLRSQKKLSDEEKEQASNYVDSLNGTAGITKSTPKKAGRAGAVAQHQVASHLSKVSLANAVLNSYIVDGTLGMTQSFQDAIDNSYGSEEWSTALRAAPSETTNATVEVNLLAQQLKMKLEILLELEKSIMLKTSLLTGIKL